MSLEAWALAALQSLSVYKEDVGSPDKPAQLEMIAKAVTQAAREQRGWQGSVQQLIALEIAVIDNETHASLRIHRNECHEHECDSTKINGIVIHRAISLFQLHAKPLSSPEIWPQLGFMTFESTLLSAKEASRALVRARGACSQVNGEPIAMTLVSYAGRGCQLDRWMGWKARVATYNRVLRVPMPRQAPADSQKQAAQ